MTKKQLFMFFFSTFYQVFEVYVFFPQVDMCGFSDSGAWTVVETSFRRLGSDV